MSSNHATTTRSGRWSLEVVRGRDVGRLLELAGGEVVLGNAIDGAIGIDLRDQEAGSPRRMAARQAMIESRGSDLFIRDLDSPGGTFVNRRRLLAGQASPLLPGDEIQVGGVLLRVKAPAGPPPIPTAPGRLPEPFAIDGSVVCRTWDDFLTLAAQRWNDLRAELTSGRLGGYLHRIGRIDLLPRQDQGQADHRLDDWLGRLPTSRSTAPELDVHPDRVEVPAAGGTTRHLLRITNVGYRLLQTTARVEPAGVGWVRIAAPHDGRPFLTIEQTDLPIEVDRPEGGKGPTSAEVVLESNGGTRRVPIVVREIRPPSMPPDPVAISIFPSIAPVIVRMRPEVRVAAGVGIAVATRSLVLFSGPTLSVMAVAFAAIGSLAGLVAGWRKGRNVSDAVAAGVAAGMGGVLIAAVVHASVGTVEAMLGAWASSPWASFPAWAALGAAVAGLSWLFLPFREASS